MRLFSLALVPEKEPKWLESIENDDQELTLNERKGFYNVFIIVCISALHFYIIRLVIKLSGMALTVQFKLSILQFATFLSSVPPQWGSSARNQEPLGFGTFHTYT